MIGIIAEHCISEAIRNLKAAELCLKTPPKPEYKQDSDVMLIFVSRVLEILEDVTAPKESCPACGGDGYNKGPRLGDEPCPKCYGWGTKNK